MHSGSKLHFPQSSILFLSSTSQTSSQNHCLYTVPLTPLPLHLLPSGFCPFNSTKQDPATVDPATYWRMFQAHWDSLVVTHPAGPIVSLKHTPSLQ